MYLLSQYLQISKLLTYKEKEMDKLLNSLQEFEIFFNKSTSLPKLYKFISSLTNF